MRKTLVVVVFLAATDIAGAQHEDRFYVSPFWGGSLMETSIDDDSSHVFGFEGGFQLGARGGYHLSHRIAIEGTYRYSPNGLEKFGLRDPFFGDVRFETKTDSHAITGDVRVFAFDVASTVRTFLAGGIGIEIPTGPDAESSLLWNVGGGTEWSLRPGLGLRGDVRYVAVSDFFLTDRTEGGVELHGGLVVGF
jgi:hypothetical protein